MTTKDDFLFSKDKHQSITNNVLHTDKSNQYSNHNLNQNQNCPILISVQYRSNPKNDKYFGSKVSDKHDKKRKSDAWNKSDDFSFHTLTLNNKAEEKAKTKWKKDSLSDVNSSTLSLHINAYENLKEITEHDTICCENVELKMNKIHTDKQLFPPFMIQNPFEFPRQQEKEQINEPEVVGFRANQRLLGSNQPTSSNAIRIPTAIAGSHVSNINRGYPPIRLVRPNLMGVQRYVYTRFNKISYSKVKDFNIYGIITNVKYESSNDETGKSQDEYRLKVNDGTQDDDINVTAYCTLDEIPSDVFQRGRIVRFHRLTKNYFKNKQDGFYLCGRIGNTTSVLLFDVPPPGAKIRFNPCFRSAVMYSQSTKDEEFLTELIANANKILDKSGTLATQNEASTSGSASQLSLSPAVQFIAPQVSMNGSIVIPVNAPRFANSPVRQTVHQPLLPPPASTVPQHVLRPANKFMTKTPATGTVFKKMDELIYGNSCYYNVLFQIVSCYKNGKGNIVLRVWDGLQNPNQLFISPSYDLRLIYGDLKRERLIAEQKKLYDVVCYDEHGRSAAGLKAGDYIALINVHFYSQYPGFLPALIMHKGAGKRGNSVAGRRIIKLTKETTANYFDIIDGLIKEHERSLSTVEENQINNIAQPLPPKSLPLRSSLVEEYDSDDSFYDDSLFQTVETNQVTVPATSLKSTNSNALANIAADIISTIPDVAPSSTRNDTLITIAPTTPQPTTAAVAPVLTITTPHVVSIPAISQCSTITLSSDDGSTQSSCIIISQRSPEKNNETITLSSTPATPIPISSRSTALQNNATILPIPTVSNASPTLNIPIPSAFRRSATVAFPQTHNPEPPSKRLCLCGLTNDNEEEESSTQALFDKLQDIENDGDYLNETMLSLTEEQKKINAITDTQLERMWEEVENAQLQPSQSISQWGTWNR